MEPFVNPGTPEKVRHAYIKCHSIFGLSGGSGPVQVPFEEESTLASICEKIIVPNIEMRECDVELFEDTPEQYVTQDLEGNF